MEGFPSHSSDCSGGLFPPLLRTALLPKGSVVLTFLLWAVCAIGPLPLRLQAKGHYDLTLVFRRLFSETISADCKRGRRKGAASKNVKSVKKCQKVFRHFSTIFAQGKKRQKSSKNVKKFFDTFRQFSRRHHFPRPLLGASDNTKLRHGSIGGEKSNKHKQLFGNVLEGVGVKFVYVLPFLGETGNT